MQKFFNYPKIDLLLGGVGMFFSPHWRVTALSSSVPLVVTFHDLFFEIMPRFFTWRRRLWHWFMDYEAAADRARKIIAVSENTKKDLIKLYRISPDKIQVIYPGVHNALHPPLSLREGEGELLPFLFLGTFEPRKNLDAILSAYEQYHDASSEKRPLVLAGSQGWKTRIRIPKKIRDKVSVRLNVSEEEKADLYRRAFALLFPSFYEGFGFPVLEAASAGVPVLASFSGSLSEIAGDFALLVNPLRTAQIAEGMIALETDEQLYAALKHKGISAAKRFDWNKTASETLKVFQSI